MPTNAMRARKTREKIFDAAVKLFASHNQTASRPQTIEFLIGEPSKIQAAQVFMFAKTTTITRWYMLCPPGRKPSSRSYQLRIGDFGLRIMEEALGIGVFLNPQSTIRNPQSEG